MGKLGWKDISDVPIDVITLFDERQLLYLPRHFINKKEFVIVLRAKPYLEWFMRHKCPALNGWLDDLLDNRVGEVPNAAELEKIEHQIVENMEDWVIYVTDPAAYDRQRFLTYDDRELLELTDFAGKTVLDIGAGTGRLAFAAAPYAKAVFAVEPVFNLRKYIKQKALAMEFRNVYSVDGLLEEIPFPDGFADIVMGGHVFGEDPEIEAMELERVIKPGGMVILCPGNNDKDNGIHQFLVSRGFSWSRFEEPGDGWKRKYWKVKSLAEARENTSELSAQS